MIEQDKKVRKGLGPRRDEACLRVERDIVIPAGTILREGVIGGHMGALVGFDKGICGYFIISLPAGESLDDFKRVVA